MKPVALLILLSFATLVATAKQYMGYKVSDMPFRIAGGKTLMLPVTDAGTVPAESPQIRIEDAGMLFVRSKDEWHTTAIVWQFGFENKAIGRIERVSVTRVAPDETASPVLVDDKVVVKGEHWTGSAKPVDAGPKASSWLYEEGQSIFVFRFDITPSKGEPVTLYQPVLYSAEAKTKLRDVLEQWRRAR